MATPLGCGVDDRVIAGDVNVEQTASQYGGFNSGNIGKWRTFVVSRSASMTIAVAAIR